MFVIVIVRSRSRNRCLIDSNIAWVITITSAATRATDDAFFSVLTLVSARASVGGSAVILIVIVILLERSLGPLFFCYLGSNSGDGLLVVFEVFFPFLFRGDSRCGDRFDGTVQKINRRAVVFGLCCAAVVLFVRVRTIQWRKIKVLWRQQRQRRSTAAGSLAATVYRTRIFVSATALAVVVGRGISWCTLWRNIVHGRLPWI